MSLAYVSAARVQLAEGQFSVSVRRPAPEPHPIAPAHRRTSRRRRAGHDGARDRHAAARHGQGTFRHGERHVHRFRRRPNVTPKSRASSARCSSARTTGRRRSTIRSPRWCSIGISNRSTACAATSSPATSPSSRTTATSSTTRSRRASSSRCSRSSIASSSAIASAWLTRSSSLKTEPDFTLDETFEFDRENAPWADLGRRAERALAPARQERRGVADAHRQDLGRNARHPAEALRARAQAHRAGHERRHVREFHELVRARVRPALELFLAAQFRGIPHPDEPVLRGHRRFAAARSTTTSRS